MRTSRKRCRRRVELAGEAESVFLKFCVFLSRSLIDFSHPCNEKQRKKHTVALVMIFQSLVTILPPFFDFERP